MGLISKSLVGPFNFINHACDECAQLEWEENAVTNSIHVTAKKGKRIQKDDEVFINYKGVKCEDGDVFPCGMCSKSTAASAAASSLPTSTAAVIISEPSTAALSIASTAPASSISTASTAPASSTNEQDIDMLEDAGCIEVSNAIAAAANAATVAAIESHGLKNKNINISGTGDNDDSSFDSSSSASVIDFAALRSTSVTTAAVSSTAVSSTAALSSNDDFDDEDEDDHLIIDKGTLIAQDADNRTTYGIIIGMVKNQWSAEYKYEDGDDTIHSGKSLEDNASILLAYNYFQNLPVENKDVGYAMFGLKEFNVVFHTAELGFTYYNDSIIGKNMVQSSTSCRIDNNDILVSIGDENVFGVEYQQFVEILGRHDERLEIVPVDNII